jgi:hypothetical protein
MSGNFHIGQYCLMISLAVTGPSDSNSLLFQHIKNHFRRRLKAARLLFLSSAE